jgi:hypothetical protein
MMDFQGTSHYPEFLMKKLLVISDQSSGMAIKYNDFDNYFPAFLPSLQKGV